MQKFLLTVTLGLGLAWAAPVAGRMVEVLDTAGRVVATGTLSGHLTVRGDLDAARTVRVSTTVNGVTTVRVFTLAGPITARDPEAERLGVSVSGRVLTLESALDGPGGRNGAAPATRTTPARGGADDGTGHDAGDDHGGRSGGPRSGGHGADDGPGHDAGDDHGGRGRGHGGSSGGHNGGHH
ncbi:MULTISPECIES: hypothetical protein [Deinococcus]|uniref:DUF5666 domain-containing protein n=1 Tax=Deinococcus rufus TaxID=2136097 RepID=A0ABV7ZCM7_9DEIO|nr:hypothetical protein [Deinococcus sp. AB2017081]WQE95614.1 hypothetical protein U2P90_01675 [Deinococcus sp. AB2017081]